MSNLIEKGRDFFDRPADEERRNFLRKSLRWGGVLGLMVVAHRLLFLLEGEEQENLVWSEADDVFGRYPLDRRNWLERQKDWRSVVIQEAVPLEPYAEVLKGIVGLPADGNSVIQRQKRVIFWEGLITEVDSLMPDYATLQPQDKLYVGPKEDSAPVIGKLLEAWKRVR
jgi:hypothetical protein